MISDAIKRDNSFILQGGAYRGGYRVPGFTRVKVNGVEYTFSEKTTVYEAIELVEALGEDCTNFRARLDHWIETGE